MIPTLCFTIAALAFLVRFWAGRVARLELEFEQMAVQLRSANNQIVSIQDKIEDRYMTIIYVRKDGTTFEGPLFHPHMEHAGVIDPLDGRLKAFETVFDENRNPIKRVED